MKSLKLQQDILKACDQRWKKPVTMTFMYTETEESVIVLVNNYYTMVVPKDDWWLDMKSIFGTAGGRVDSVVKLIEKAQQVNEPLTDPHITEEDFQNGKLIKVKRFELGSEQIFVNEALFKYLDLSETTFTGSNSKSAVLAYEGGKLVGLFLPVNRRKKEI